MKTLIQGSFSSGVVRDVPRWEIPDDGCYDVLDYLVDRPGLAYKRGGTEFLNSAIPAPNVILVAVAAPEYPGDPRVIAIGSTGAARNLYDVTTGTPATGVSLGTTEPYENPPTYVDKLIITDGRGALVPKKAYLSTGVVAVANLGGSPPLARVSCVHLSYLVLANSIVNPNRLWFSPIPDIEDTWDTDEAYIDAPEPITGLASVQGVLVVFMRGQSTRILGSVPPGTTGENMEQQPLDSVGCIDARSIVKIDEVVYFANEDGVYWTNGAGVDSITEKDDNTGISTLWAEQMSGFAPALGAVVCAGAWLNQWILLSILHTNGSKYQWIYHTQTGSWIRASDGIAADMYATRFAPNSEIYAASSDATDPLRLLRLSTIFTPGTSNETDANGEVINPLLEVTFGDAGVLKSIAQGRATIRATSGGAGPTITISTANGLNPTSFTSAATLGLTSGRRIQFPAMADTQLVSVRISNSGASSATEISGVELDVSPYPPGVVGDAE